MPEITITRLSIFISVLLLMMLVEAWLPRRIRQQPRQSRWFTNLSFAVINIAVLRLLGLITAVAVADYALQNNWGLLSLSPVPLPLYVEIILGVVLLDFAIYLQHVASHKVPFLWRFHKVHHADRDIDVTTGIRFHPVEALLSMLYKCVIVLVLGPVTIAVVLFEIILNASAMFNHANVKLPTGLDRGWRYLIVTPDMHRVHHSDRQRETDSNYGFFLPFWDRLCGTYIAQPAAGHQDMVIGLAEHQNSKPSSIPWCLALPFKTRTKNT